MSREKAIERRKNEPTKCPKCQSDNWQIDDAEPATVTGPESWNFDLSCRDCKNVWHEVWFY